MKMEPTKPQTISRIINRHLTPYAIFLVVMAALASGLHKATEISLGIVVFTGIGNVVFINLMHRRPAKLAVIRNVRIAFNYFFNIVIVGLLWPYWPPIWLLLLLSISTIAIFEDRKNTVATAVLFTMVMFLILYVRGGGYENWISACEMLAYIVSILTASLLINSLAHEIQP